MKVYLVPFLLCALWIQSFEILAQGSAETETHFENENAVISTSIIDCVSEKNGTAKQYMSISITNKLEQSINVSFKREMWFAGDCTSCNSNSDEYISTITLDPNQEISGACGEPKDLLIFYKMMKLKGVRQLTHFELRNINVQKL